MNRNKFLQIQNSFKARGEDLDVLNHIVDDLIYSDMYKQMFKHPHISDDFSTRFELNGSVVVTRGLSIPKNISELKSNKFTMSKRVISKLARDGWKSNKYIWGSNNIRFEYNEDDGKIVRVNYEFKIKPMNWVDKLLFKMFKIT